ncbi:hypothetical protein AVEN_139488-1 [Araneus ventricosus]|uniref:Uncharacterized protein n=1 Tax=Araneus ventricosus TaxID=182803 RepID=A0A4Y2UVB2_ARAVE|nr:hypothetical protein AVEN_139488-1 [Araneus ventricosus]
MCPSTSRVMLPPHSSDVLHTPVMSLHTPVMPLLTPVMYKGGEYDFSASKAPFYVRGPNVDAAGKEAQFTECPKYRLFGLRRARKPDSTECPVIPSSFECGEPELIPQVPSAALLDRRAKSPSSTECPVQLFWMRRARPQFHRMPNSAGLLDAASKGRPQFTECPVPSLLDVRARASPLRPQNAQFTHLFWMRQQERSTLSAIPALLDAWRGGREP